MDSLCRVIRVRVICSLFLVLVGSLVAAQTEVCVFISDCYLLRDYCNNQREGKSENECH